MTDVCWSWHIVPRPRHPTFGGGQLGEHEDYALATRDGLPHASHDTAIEMRLALRIDPGPPIQARGWELTIGPHSSPETATGRDVTLSEVLGLMPDDLHAWALSQHSIALDRTRANLRRDLAPDGGRASLARAHEAVDVIHRLLAEGMRVHGRTDAATEWSLDLRKAMKPREGDPLEQLFFAALPTVRAGDGIDG